MKASNYAAITNATLDELRILPPMEPKDKSITWARGSIRDKDFNELTITGPRLPVLYSGCRFNNVVFSIRGPGADDGSHEFETFLHKVLSRVENAVGANPDKFKPGLKNAALLHFDRDFIRPSSYSPDNPNELRVKLSVKRDVVDDNGEVVDLIDTLFVDENGGVVDPQDITSGSEIIPIIRIGYYRNNTKFGLNLTMLKALVYPSAKRVRTIDYGDLLFDF